MLSQTTLSRPRTRLQHLQQTDRHRSTVARYSSKKTQELQEAKKRNKRRTAKRKVRSTPVSPQMDTCLLIRIPRIQECSFRQNRCAHCKDRKSTRLNSSHSSPPRM